MSRIPLTQRLQDAAATAAEAAHRSIDADQAIAERVERSRTRRELLRDAGALGLASALAGTIGSGVPDARAAAPSRVVVVGAGLAGLTCAYRLKQAGHDVELHEASSRAGGRCWTVRGAFADGQYVEHGGELIDQGHTAIRQLAQELGLTLDDLLRAEANGSEPFFHFDGARYSYRQATDDLKAIWQKIHSDVSAASYPTLYNLSTARGRALDRLSIADWIEESVPGGRQSKLGKLLDVAYTIEYGAETSAQSSLNLLYLLGYSGQGQLRIFGPSNEKYRVHGGNDQIPARLAQALGSQITTSSALVAVAARSGGGYELSFEQGSATRAVVADHVVLALPFSILRSSVDLSASGFSPLKRTAIAELGMGANSKLHAQFSDRHWERLGCNGESYADTGYQSSWDATRGQQGTSGILVAYTGGRTAASYTAVS